MITTPDELTNQATKCYAHDLSETKVSRRGRGEDAIYFATAKNRYVGSVSLGYGPTGDVRSALDSLLDPLSADHAQLAGAGDPARRVQRPHRP